MIQCENNIFFILAIDLACFCIISSTWMISQNSDSSVIKYDVKLPGWGGWFSHLIMRHSGNLHRKTDHCMCSRIMRLGSDTIWGPLLELKSVAQKVTTRSMGGVTRKRCWSPIPGKFTPHSAIFKPCFVFVEVWNSKLVYITFDNFPYGIYIIICMQNFPIFLIR